MLLLHTPRACTIPPMKCTTCFSKVNKKSATFVSRTYCETADTLYILVTIVVAVVVVSEQMGPILQTCAAAKCRASSNYTPGHNTYFCVYCTFIPQLHVAFKKTTLSPSLYHVATHTQMLRTQTLSNWKKFHITHCMGLRWDQSGRACCVWLV